jgi:peptide deformylase
MSIKEIIQGKFTGGTVESDELLSAVAAEVTDFGSLLAEVVRDLRDTLWHHSICVGLAAPQIGVSLRIAVLNWQRESADNDLILVNPRIIEVTGKKDTKHESCMSVWGFLGDVVRRDKVIIQYSDISGGSHRKTFDGFGARVVQHELDHLDGTLYSAKLKEGSQLSAASLFDGHDWRYNNDGLN